MSGRDVWGSACGLAGVLLVACGCTAPAERVPEPPGQRRAILAPVLCDASSEWDVNLAFTRADPLPASGGAPDLGPRVGFPTPVDAVRAVADAPLVLGVRGRGQRTEVPVLSSGGELGIYRLERIEAGWRVSGGLGCGALQGSPDDDCVPEAPLLDPGEEVNTLLLTCTPD